MELSLRKVLRRGWDTFLLAARNFNQIDGGQRAAAFAYSAFFSLFPLIILSVTAATFFVDRATAAGAVISYVERSMPLGGDMQRYIFDTVSRVVKSRGQAGTFALLMLVWVSAQFFTTLMRAINRAWGAGGGKWWNFPLKTLSMLAIMVLAVLAGIAVPLAGKLTGTLFKTGLFLPLAYKLALFVLPWFIVFLSLAFFYKTAPHRRTEYSEVWFGALCATLLLNAAQSVFVLYLAHVASFSALYGAFGAIMALLLWIYVSGVIFIFCACLCAAQARTGRAG